MYLNKFTAWCLSVLLLFLPSENYQYTVLESLPVRSVVAKIKAADADIGSNAEMDYRIMDSDGAGVFNVTTDEDTQDGVITLLKVTAGWTDGPDDRPLVAEALRSLRRTLEVHEVRREEMCYKCAITQGWVGTPTRCESTCHCSPANNPPDSHFQRRLR